MGASAGSHLALLQAYKSQQPLKARAVVDFFGPTDLMALYNAGGLFPSMLSNVTGQTPEINPSIYLQSSPVNFVDAASALTIMIHGGKDVVIPLSQSELLASRLQSHGVKHQFLLYPNQGHGWIGPDLEDAFSKISAFLRTNVK
jgi:dipeptidyl aminopeptidase/acylaminoacyl peptidase